MTENIRIECVREYGLVPEDKDDINLMIAQIPGYEKRPEIDETVITEFAENNVLLVARILESDEYAVDNGVVIGAASLVPVQIGLMALRGGCEYYIADARVVPDYVHDYPELWHTLIENLMSAAAHRGIPTGKILVVQPAVAEGRAA